MERADIRFPYPHMFHVKQKSMLQKKPCEKQQSETSKEEFLTDGNDRKITEDFTGCF
jgi:hypothetical protein